MCEAVTATGKVCTSQMTAKNAWTSMLWFSQALASAGGPNVYERGLDDPAFVKAFEVMSEEQARQLGCEGVHRMGDRYWMPCNEHPQ